MCDVFTQWASSWELNNTQEQIIKTGYNNKNQYYVTII